MRKAGYLLVAALAATACKNARESDQTSAQPSAAKQVEQAQEQSKEAFDRAKEAQEKAIDEQQDVDKSLEDVNEKRQELAEAEAKAQREQQESQAAQQAAQNEAQSANQQAQAAQSRATQLQQSQVQQQAQMQQETHESQAREAAEAQRRTTTTTPQATTPTPESSTTTTTTTTKPDPWANAAPNNATDQSDQSSKSFEAAAPSGTQSLAHGALDQASSDEIVIHREGSEALRVKIDAQTKVERNGAAASVSDLTKGEQVTVTYRLDGNQPVAESVHIVQ